MSEPEPFKWEYEKEAERLRERIAALEAERDRLTADYRALSETARLARTLENDLAAARTRILQLECALASLGPIESLELLNFTPDTTRTATTEPNTTS